MPHHTDRGATGPAGLLPSSSGLQLLNFKLRGSKELSAFDTSVRVGCFFNVKGSITHS